MEKKRIEVEMKINNILLEGGYFLVNGDLTNALKIYKQVTKLYDPEYDKNKSVYHKIMKFYDNILNLKNNPIIKNRDR